MGLDEDYAFLLDERSVDLMVASSSMGFDGVLVCIVTQDLMGVKTDGVASLYMAVRILVNGCIDTLVSLNLSTQVVKTMAVLYFLGSDVCFLIQALIDFGFGKY